MLFATNVGTQTLQLEVEECDLWAFYKVTSKNGNVSNMFNYTRLSNNCPSYKFWKQVYREYEAETIYATAN